MEKKYKEIQNNCTSISRFKKIRIKTSLFFKVFLSKSIPKKNPKTLK